MADFAYTGGDVLSSAGPGVTDQYSAQLVSGATSTKGSYTQLIASTAHSAAGFIVYLYMVGISSYGLVDIAVGAAGSEQVIVSNMYCRNSPNVGRNMGVAYIPISIPAGTRISARWQAGSGASVNLQCCVTLVSGVFSAPTGMSGSVTMGANTANSTGTIILTNTVAANAKSAWTQMTASTSADIKALMICDGSYTSIGTMKYQYDIAIGAAGSETTIIDNIPGMGTNNGNTNSQFVGPFPCRIPAGSRVAYRNAANVSNAGNSTDLVFIGFY